MSQLIGIEYLPQTHTTNYDISTLVRGAMLDTGNEIFQHLCHHLRADTALQLRGEMQ